MTEWSEASVGDGFGQQELVAPEEVDVTPHDGGQSGNVRILRNRPEVSDLAQCFLHVNCVPVHDGVEGKPDTKLFDLALAQWASDFATLAMMDTATKPVTQLLAVQLNQDPPTKLLIVNVPQNVQRLDDATKLG